MEHPPQPMNPSPSPRLNRRHWNALLGASLFGALTACASTPSPAGINSTTIPESQLASLLARAFPYTRSFSGLADLTLQSPRLRLLPQANRLGTELDLQLAERLAGTRYSGRMDLDYGLRFDATEGAIRMSNVRVNRLEIDQVPRAQQALLAQYAPQVAERLLDNMVLYRLPADRLALARNLGLTVSALRVVPEGVRMEMRR